MFPHLRDPDSSLSEGMSSSLQNLSWKDVQSLPCFIVNLEKCEDRWISVMPLLLDAGFMTIHRQIGVDASDPAQLSSAWRRHGTPKLDIANDSEFGTYLGKQGCLLSHADIWKTMIDNSVPAAIILEDDVVFHPQFNDLAPLYWEHTPRDFDILFLGAQLEKMVNAHIVRVPVFCTHAMIVTLDGARRLYNFVMQNKAGVRTIDCMLKEEMERMLINPAVRTFQWYAWNGTLFPAPEAIMAKGWTKRNMGLVFQDEKWGSLVREW